MSSEDQIVSFSLELNVEPGLTGARKVYTIMSRTMNLADRLELVNAAQINRKIALLNSVRLAYLAVQTARMAAGDPLAWITAGLAVAETTVEAASQITMDVRQLSGSETPQ